MTARFSGAKARRLGARLAVLLVVLGVGTGTALAAPIGWTQRTQATNDNIFSIDAATGGTTLLAATGLVPSTFLAAAPDGTLYGTNTDTNSLYRIDPVTAVPTLVGPLGVPAASTLTATGDGRLWMASNTLHQINPTTGAATQVGNIGDVGALPAAGLAGTCDGRLFAVLLNGDFVSVNPTTGVGTVIGSTAVGSLSIAFDATETLRGVRTDLGLGNLYALDLTTGNATTGPTTQSDQESIAFPRSCPSPAPAPAATPIQATVRFTG